jgi:hypothetical protein
MALRALRLRRAATRGPSAGTATCYRQPEAKPTRPVALGNRPYSGAPVDRRLIAVGAVDLAKVRDRAFRGKAKRRKQLRRFCAASPARSDRFALGLKRSNSSPMPANTVGVPLEVDAVSVGARDDGLCADPDQRPKIERA